MKSAGERPRSPSRGVLPPSRGVLGADRQGEGEGAGLSHSDCPRLLGVSSQADRPCIIRRAQSR